MHPRLLYTKTSRSSSAINPQERRLRAVISELPTWKACSKTIFFLHVNFTGQNQANRIQQQCEQQQQDAQRLEELRENLKDATTPAYQILDDLENAKQIAGEMKKDVFYNTEAV